MKSANYVLVHGAWHGGWCWSRVAERLRAAGHRAFTPTCTGLGERAHLMSPDITLDTFTDDITGMIEAEELTEVILVGHSFGGLPVSGVAERMPSRLRHLVYLDALLVEPGQRPFDILAPDIVARRLKTAEDSSGGVSLPPQPPESFGVTDPGDIACWVSSGTFFILPGTEAYRRMEELHARWGTEIRHPGWWREVGDAHVLATDVLPSSGWRGREGELRDYQRWQNDLNVKWFHRYRREVHDFRGRFFAR